jgi:hypothetical protein
MKRPPRFLETPGTKCPAAQRHVPDKPMPYVALIRIMLFYLAFHIRHMNRVVYIRNTPLFCLHFTVTLAMEHVHA